MISWYLDLRPFQTSIISAQAKTRYDFSKHHYFYHLWVNDNWQSRYRFRKASHDTITYTCIIGTNSRVNELEEVKSILDCFQKHGHSEIDSARVYASGTTEEMLGEVHWDQRGLVMGTKLYPTKGQAMTGITPEEWTHSAEDVRAGLMKSLAALKTASIDLFYLHAPDRNTPIEVTLAEVDKLHKEGYFRRFGISNYQSWEVARICDACEKNGWIKPTVYQGLYNAFQRSIEPELVPCLRHYGIGIYAFQPLAGGFLTNKYKRNQKEYEKGSRFDPSAATGKMHQGRYMDERHFDALETLRATITKHDLTEAECGLRWMIHHSVLDRSLDDAVIVGASRASQLEENLSDLEKGPLPEEVVKALDAGWAVISGTYIYWR